MRPPIDPCQQIAVGRPCLSIRVRGWRHPLAAAMSGNIEPTSYSPDTLSDGLCVFRQRYSLALRLFQMPALSEAAIQGSVSRPGGTLAMRTDTGR